MMCPYQCECSMLCPRELYQGRYLACARYQAANTVGMGSVPHDMTAINYALAEKLKSERCRPCI